jgi:hypothetical protein
MGHNHNPATLLQWPIVNNQDETSMSPTTHLSAQPNSGTMARTNASNSEEQLELSLTSGGTEKWYRLFGRQFGDFFPN